MTFMLINLAHATATQQWDAFVCNAHASALNLQQSFSVAEHANANLMVPRGNIITTASDTSYVAQDLLASYYSVHLRWIRQQQLRRAYGT